MRGPASLFFTCFGAMLASTTFWLLPAEATRPPRPPVVSFLASDIGFEGPETVPAGLTALRLQNRGQEPHQLQLLKLSDGRTPAELSTFLHASHGEVPQWAERMGGPNGVGPGDSAEAVIDLEPGIYVLTCAIPHHSHPHPSLDTPKTLRVIDGASRADFTGNIHMAMVDYGFVIIQDVRSGPHTFHVVNRGSQAHQVSLVRLNPGASAEDMLAAFQSTDAGSLPGRLMGGMTALEPGRRGMFTASLSPGRYAMICLFPNPSAQNSHAANGMVMNFIVE